MDTLRKLEQAIDILDALIEKESRTHYETDNVVELKTVKHTIEDISEEITEGDASLIASAPEMLAMLKEIRENVPTTYYRKIRKIIAKAEGGK